MNTNTASFGGFDLPEMLQNGLSRIGFVSPTPIQAKAIPSALEGKDVLGSAQTGSGKTAAFVIPALAKLGRDAYGNVLILTPTRELAAQVFDVISKILPCKSDIKAALLIGGEQIGKQFKQLRAAPRIVVGTPGRISDHIKRKTLSVAEVDFLVLDEIDRMLDMGFGIQIEEIVKQLSNDRQTLMFSATLPTKIEALAKKYLREPVRVSVGETGQPALKIQQEILHLNHSAKYPTLLSELEARQGSVIVFVKTKRGADQLAEQLRENDHRADAIHGDLRQRQRDQVIQKFRNKAYRVMVATDVAARGLDVPHIEHVINYDLPQCPEDYIHRIGRTARAGATGAALSLVSPSERGLWNDITRILDKDQVTVRGGSGVKTGAQEKPKFSKWKKHGKPNGQYTNRQSSKKAIKYHP